MQIFEDYRKIYNFGRTWSFEEYTSKVGILGTTLLYIALIDGSSGCTLRCLLAQHSGSFITSPQGGSRSWCPIFNFNLICATFS